MSFEYRMFKFEWEKADLNRSEFEAKALFLWQVADRRMEQIRTHTSRK